MKQVTTACRKAAAVNRKANMQICAAKYVCICGSLCAAARCVCCVLCSAVLCSARFSVALRSTQIEFPTLTTRVAAKLDLCVEKTQALQMALLGFPTLTTRVAAKLDLCVGNTQTLQMALLGFPTLTTSLADRPIGSPFCAARHPRRV